LLFLILGYWFVSTEGLLELIMDLVIVGIVEVV
jgi:hypothetical protein